MARIVGGSPLGELSGKMGGLVFARNKGGPYVRQYAIPVNPNTVAQVNARAAFGSSSAGWHGLNSVQKSQWQNYAESIFSPLNQPNMGQFSGINAYTSLSNTVANANTRVLSPLDPIFGDYTLTADATEATITFEDAYAINTDPPSDFNTGTLQTLGGNQTVQLAVDLASINDILAWSVRFDVVLVTNNVPGPTPTVFNFGEEGFTNTAGNKVGFQCFMSESVVQLGDFIRNPYYINLGTTKLIQATSLGVEGAELTIVGQPTGMNRFDYQKLPSVGDIVRLTFVMIDQYGQRKVIGSGVTNVSTSS